MYIVYSLTQREFINIRLSRYTRFVVRYIILSHIIYCGNDFPRGRFVHSSFQNIARRYEGQYTLQYQYQQQYAVPTTQSWPKIYLPFINHNENIL